MLKEIYLGCLSLEDNEIDLDNLIQWLLKVKDEHCVCKSFKAHITSDFIDITGQREETHEEKIARETKEKLEKERLEKLKQESEQKQLKNDLEQYVRLQKKLKSSGVI